MKEISLLTGDEICRDYNEMVRGIKTRISDHNQTKCYNRVSLLWVKIKFK